MTAPVELTEIEVDPLLDIKEVMQITKMGQSTIYKKIKEGRFPKQTKVTSKATWLKSDIMKHLAALSGNA